MLSTRIFVFALLSISSVLCKKICNYDDSACLTESAQRLYKTFILGTTPGVGSSDPLRKDLIEANLPTMKYKLINSSLSGMIDCQVNSVIISRKEMKYDYNVSCPHVTMETDFELKGELDSKMYEGTGSCKTDLFDFEYHMYGHYSKNIDNAGKHYFHIKNHILETDAKGKVEYESVSHGGEPKDKSNENCQVVDKLGRQSAMEAYIDKFFENLEIYFSVVPLEDIYYYPD